MVGERQGYTFWLSLGQSSCVTGFDHRDRKKKRSVLPGQTLITTAMGFPSDTVTGGFVTDLFGSLGVTPK